LQISSVVSYYLLNYDFDDESDEKNKLYLSLTKETYGSEDIIIVEHLAEILNEGRNKVIESSFLSYPRYNINDFKPSILNMKQRTAYIKLKLIVNHQVTIDDIRLINSLPKNEYLIFLNYLIELFKVRNNSHYFPYNAILFADAIIETLEKDYNINNEHTDFIDKYLNYSFEKIYHMIINKEFSSDDLKYINKYLSYSNLLLAEVDNLKKSFAEVKNCLIQLSTTLNKKNDFF
jgi:hypothetical protein